MSPKRSMSSTRNLRSHIDVRCLTRFALAIGLLITLSVRIAAADEPATHPLVTARSHASFDVKHLYLLSVKGTLPIVSGSAVFDPRTGLPAHVEATLDARRIKTDDADRDDDLQGPDWFETNRFPLWTFSSTTIAATDTGFLMRGSLTVHGVAQPVTLDVRQVRRLPHPVYHAAGNLDRRLFGMKVTPQDGLIGKDVAISLDVEFL